MGKIKMQHQFMTKYCTSITIEHNALYNARYDREIDDYVSESEAIMLRFKPASECGIEVQPDYEDGCPDQRGFDLRLRVKDAATLVRLLLLDEKVSEEYDRQYKECYANKDQLA